MSETPATLIPSLQHLVDTKRAVGDAPKLHVYLAARFDRKHSLRLVRRVMESYGITVTSRWLYEHDSPNFGESLSDASNRWATDDLSDISGSDVVISFTESSREYNSGGRQVEYGYALAMGKVQLVVGPRENVFHALDGTTVFTDSVAMLVQMELAMKALTA